MANKVMQMKKNIQLNGKVQLPVKVGEEVCYLHAGILIWTDRVKRILEITQEYIRFETAGYVYTIFWSSQEDGKIRNAA